MRTTRVLTTLALATLFAAPGIAQRGAAEGRGEVLRRLDTNQDGRLDESERAAAREKFRQRIEARRDAAGESAPRGRRGQAPREQASGDPERMRRGRGDARRLRGPLGRALERRFGNGDGRVGRLERMRLRRFVERWRGVRGGADDAQRPEREDMRRRGEGRRGGRPERSRGRRPNADSKAGVEEF